MIQIPQNKSEFELQAELFSALKTAGYLVRGEVSARLNGKKSIFDLVIFKEDKAVVIIEVKDSPHRAVVYGKKTKQSMQYKAYNLPVIYHTTIHSVQQTLARIERVLAERELLLIAPEQKPSDCNSLNTVPGVEHH